MSISLNSSVQIQIPIQEDTEYENEAYLNKKCFKRRKSITRTNTWSKHGTIIANQL